MQPRNIIRYVCPDCEIADFTLHPTPIEHGTIDCTQCDESPLAHKWKVSTRPFEGGVWTQLHWENDDFYPKREDVDFSNEDYPDRINELMVKYKLLGRNMMHHSDVAKAHPEDTPDPDYDEPIAEGTKDDQGKIDLGLFIMDMAREIREVAVVLHDGAIKYGKRNWQQGLDTNRLEAAMLRHMTSYACESYHDDETGSSHLSHMVANIMMIMWYNNQEEADVEELCSQGDELEFSHEYKGVPYEVNWRPEDKVYVLTTECGISIHRTDNNTQKLEKEFKAMIDEEQG